jgi:VanZ family protein
MNETEASHRVKRLLLLGYLAFLVYASLYPISSFRIPEENVLALFSGKTKISRADALTNLLVYLPLGWLLAARYPRLGTLLAALLGCGLSFAIECLQAFVPGRVPSVLDWGLNTAGSLLGAALASRVRHFPWRRSEPILEPGARARLGLVAFGTWVSAQLFPFVPAADIDYLRDGLRPVWHVLRGSESFSFAPASVCALSTLALSIILRDSLRPNRGSRVLVPLAFFAVLVAKVPVIGRQLTLEALMGALVGLLVSWKLSDSTSRNRVALIAAIGAIVVEGLRSEGAGAALLPFNWILFRTHLTNELVGAASDILAGAWPFLALAFVASGWRSFAPGRTALAGAATVFFFVLVLEWVQQFLPGRTPDVTDAVIASGAWLAAWIGISGSARASDPTPDREGRLQRLARPSRPLEPR